MKDTEWKILTTYLTNGSFTEYIKNSYMTVCKRQIIQQKTRQNSSLGPSQQQVYDKWPENINKDSVDSSRKQSFMNG